MFNLYIVDNFLLSLTRRIYCIHLVYVDGAFLLINEIIFFINKILFVYHHFSVLITSILKLWLRIPLLKTDDNDSMDVNSIHPVSSPLQTMTVNLWHVLFLIVFVLK